MHVFVRARVVLFALGSALLVCVSDCGEETLAVMAGDDDALVAG